MAVRELLMTGRIAQESNFTHLTLIPKVKDPRVASDYRPIALCNVVYRIASKVLANRLKGILPHVIFPLQSAFVPGRLISDNTLVATEVAHFMKNLKRQAEGFFSLKLDISKAYDRLEWNYLEAVLLRLGFCKQWVDIILATVRSVSYSILLNGSQQGFIMPRRGIRQGDPLSPYLFILAAEGLSSLISAAVHDGIVRGLSMSPTAPVIHHLLFADDSFLFGRADVRECRAITGILKTYATASGQCINLQKSSVVFSGNVANRTKQSLASILGVNCVAEHGLYLGLPVHVGHNKKAIFAYLKDRLSKKLISWRTKILSAGGRELLLKVVAQTIPNYVMSCYALPKTLCTELQKLCCDFFWGSTDEKKTIHWRSWDRMCIPKEKGGLGFKHLYAHNLAMLAKQGWRLMQNPHSLVARIYKAVYHPHTSFLNADMGERPSYSWRSIMEARPVLQAGLTWRIGAGRTTSIWSADWIPNISPHELSRPPDTVFDFVSDLIDEHTGSWDRFAVSACLPDDIAEKVLAIPLSRRSPVDRPAWKFDKRGHFSVKSAYKVARDLYFGHFSATSSMGDPYLAIWRTLWKANVPNKVAIFGWRAAHLLLPVRSSLVNKGYNGVMDCVVCGQVVETMEHLFVECHVAKSIFSQAPFYFMDSNLCWKDWFLDRANSLTPEMFDRFLVTLWYVWKHRNDILWRDKRQTGPQLVCAAMTWYDDYLKANSCPRQNQMNKANRRQQWSPPSPGIIKLNTDGSFLPSSSYGGAGGVLRDSHGEFIVGFAHRLDFVSSAFQSELTAIWYGVNLLITMGISQAVIETDCMAAVQAINSSVCDLSLL